MPRRAVRTKTAPLPSPDVIMAQCRDEADSGRTILSVRDRSRLLMSAALSETNSTKRRGSVESERRGSVSGRKASISTDDRQTGDELTGMSLAEKLKLFSNHTPRRATRRQTQPIRLEDLVRAEQMTNQQENIPKEEPCANVGSFVKQWERRTSVSDDPPKISSGVREKLDSENSSTQGSPSLRRRTSRSIMKRMQSFEGNGKDGEPEEAENRPPSTTDSNDKPCSRGHWTKNDAVARRRARKLDRYSAVFSSELSSPSPPEPPPNTAPSAPDEEKPKPRPLKAYGSARHSTQPITKMEISASEDTSICRNKSIRERLANMQNASESWKNRVSKGDSPDKVVTEALSRNCRASLSPPPLAASTPQSRTRNFDGPKPRSVSTLLANRKSQLEESQRGWKDRVEEKDANKFTVEGKIRSAGIDSTLSPKVTKRPGAALKRGSPRAISFHGRPSIDDGSVRKFPLLSPKSPSMRRIKLDENEDIPEEMPLSKATSLDEKETPLSTSVEERRVEVPSLDFDQVAEFLSPSKPVEQLLSDSNSRLEPDSMESWTTPSPVLKCVVRTTRPPRRRRAQGNPVRRKNERTDIFRTEYTETMTGVVDREQRRMEVETRASESKTAALASRENIAAAMEVLKRADGDRTPARDCLPYKNVMLLHVKGQRRVQVRLVEPCSSSMNSGDCFILVTPKYVFAWIGAFSNCMEQRRALDLANLIIQRKDLGVKSSDPVVEVQEAKPNSEAARLFWLSMGHSTETEVGPVGELDEDLKFEQVIQRTNAIYEMQSRELVPCENLWGKQMKKEILDPKKAFVLDFGSELYVWLGMHLSHYDRRRAVALGRKLYQQGYDYRGCGINPMFPLRDSSEDKEEEEEDSLMFSSSRPSWSIFGRISQNMETLLFTAKFFDWPDTYGSKKAGDKSTTSSLDFMSSGLDPVDADRLINEKQSPARTELEGTNLMRGGTWTAYEDGLWRTYTIDTRSVDMWLASDFEKTEMKAESLGQFSRQNTYVVRWQYRIYVGGRRNEEQRASGIGRERFVYFYWLGRDSSLTDKTASALLTVELDTEKGPQQCVVEGKEPPAFCRLFPLMTVHDGRLTRPEAPAALYIVRGDEEEEGHLSAVTATAASLRSRGTFLLVDRERSEGVLWHGRATPKHSRAVGRRLADHLSEATPAEFKARLETVREVEEGQEDARVTELLGTRREMLAEDSDPSLRLWRFSSVTGELRVAEIPAPLHHASLRTPMPYLQSDIYDVPQPALFLVDGGKDLCFLWHGWWNQGVVEKPGDDEEVPEDDNEEEESQTLHLGRTTGSARSRHNRERLAALKTAVQYGEKKYGAKSACKVVYGGLESQEFRELFPWWTERSEAAASQKMEGRSANELVTAENLLNRFTTQRFPASRLASRPLPEGVDPLFLEHFLEDAEFKDIFRMTRHDFQQLAQWKKIKLKKEADLF